MILYRVRIESDHVSLRLRHRGAGFFCFAKIKQNISLVSLSFCNFSLANIALISVLFQTPVPSFFAVFVGL